MRLFTCMLASWARSIAVCDEKYAFVGQQKVCNVAIQQVTDTQTHTGAFLKMHFPLVKKIQS